MSRTPEFAWPALWTRLAGVHDRHDVGRGVATERADVPEADRAEHTPADDPFDERPSGPVASSEVPEADSIEQALPANSAGRAREYRGERPEADEADWIDQGIIEDRDDERPDS
jgi:hypothetical protein